MPHRHTTKSPRQRNSWNEHSAANSCFTFPTSPLVKHGRLSTRSANHEPKPTPSDDSFPGQPRQATSHARTRASQGPSWISMRAASKKTSTNSTTASGHSPASLVSMFSASMTRCSATPQPSPLEASRPNHSTTPYSLASSSRHNDSGKAGNGDSLSAKQTLTSSPGGDTVTPSQNSAQRTIKHTSGFTATSPSRNPHDDQTSNNSPRA